jgi:hypothetical protein
MGEAPELILTTALAQLLLERLDQPPITPVANDRLRADLRALLVRLDHELQQATGSTRRLSLAEPPDPP